MYWFNESCFENFGFHGKCRICGQNLTWGSLAIELFLIMAILLRNIFQLYYGKDLNFLPKSVFFVFTNVLPLEGSFVSK